MSNHLRFSLITAATIALTACGGGGGSSTPELAPVAPTILTAPAGPQAIQLTGLSLRTTDVLATTAATQKVSALMLDKLDRFLKKSSDIIIPTAYADACGALCQPAYPPASIPATQQLSAKLGQGGQLGSMAPQFATADVSKVKCDFTSVGVKINSIWWLDMGNQNALVNMSVPTSVDANCALTYTTGDYVVFGSTGQAVALNQDVLGDVSDLIPAGDQGFNTSSNAIYMSKNTGLVRELQIDKGGNVARVDLTTATQPVCSKGGKFAGQVAYDGKYLVGNASQFAGVMIYEKGNTAFKFIRDDAQNFPTPCTTSVVLNDTNQFIVWQNNAAQVVDVVNGTESVWAKYAQAPQSMTMFMGRSGSIIGGDRCNYWDYSKAQQSSIYAAPTTYKWDLPYAGDVTQMITPMSVAPKYSRVSAGFAYCVTAQMNNFIRQDLTSGNLVKVNMDALGYIPGAFQMFSDRAYATVTNTANSNVLYIEVNFNTGAATYLGTITTGGRDVVGLLKASNGG